MCIKTERRDGKRRKANKLPGKVESKRDFENASSAMWLKSGHCLKFTTIAITQEKM